MKKRILMIGYNYAPEPTGIGKYSGEMIDWLVKRGYDCTVITAYPYYPHWKVQEPYYKNRFWYSTEKQGSGAGGSLTVCRCPMYVPALPSGLKRILLDLSFMITAFFKLMHLMPGKKFDFVITVVPSFQFGLLGILYKKIRKAKFLYHIQDMQIEAARDLQMIKSEKLINALFRCEKYIFDQADLVSSISEEMLRRIEGKAQKQVLLFPNWTDIKQFYPLKNGENLKRELGFRDTDKIVLYSGAIGEKQGLEAVLYAAKAFEHQTGLKFVLCGSGPYKEKLKQLAKDLKLENLFFFPLQPFEKFNQFLNAADVHLVVQKSTASDLVMPSKLTTILAVGGLALVTAKDGSGLHSLLGKHKIGKLVEAENQEALIKGIREAVSGNYEHLKMNARRFAEHFLSIDKIMGAFEASLTGASTLSFPALPLVINSKTGLVIDQREVSMNSNVKKQPKPEIRKDRAAVPLKKEKQQEEPDRQAKS